MAEFLNTSKTTYYLEELIKAAKDWILIISPYLKFNDRIKELLADKDLYKTDIRIVYGKSELAPSEINWLKELSYVRTSYCENLHAKCYLNENEAIITSMNLYEFSQVNNHEMGVHIKKNDDEKLYEETYEEARRIERMSEAIKLSADKVEEVRVNKSKTNEKVTKSPKQKQPDPSSEYEKLTTSKLAKQLGMKTAELNDLLLSKGLIRREGDGFKLTEAGDRAGGEARYSKKYGAYIIWPKDLSV